MLNVTVTPFDRLYPSESDLMVFFADALSKLHCERKREILRLLHSLHPTVTSFQIINHLMLLSSS